jgi:cytochrome c oxidase assembly factor CtaG
VTISIPVTACALYGTFAYVRGWRRLGSSSRARPAFRQGVFLCGMLAMWIALGSPLETLDEELLTFHMTQHLLLMSIAPPLLLLGEPVEPFLHGLPRFVVLRGLGPLLRYGPAKRVGHAVTHPAFCWLAATIALLGWHVPAAFELAVRSDGWHELEHLTFLATSFLFWWPVIQPWPSVARWPRAAIPVYLFLGMIANDALCACLCFSNRILYPSYAGGSSRFSLRPLEDQACSGALMWIVVMLVYSTSAVVVMSRLLSPRPRQLDHAIPTSMAS